MKRTLLTLAFLFALLTPAFAQSGATVTVGAFATTNAGNTITFNRDNIGLALAGSYSFRGLTVGGEGAGNDGRAARSRYFGTFDAYTWRGFHLAAGGGYWRFGATGGGFGQASVKYDRLALWGRYGDKNFAEGEGSFAVLKLDHVAVRPFYRFSRHGDLTRQNFHSAGLYLDLR